MEFIENRKTKLLVLGIYDEIIITSSTQKNNYTSVYHNGKKLVFDSTIDSKNYDISFKERDRINLERTLKIKEQGHKSYLRQKEKKLQEG